MSCTSNYVAQLRGYLVTLVYVLQLNIAPKVPTPMKFGVCAIRHLKVLACSWVKLICFTMKFQ